VHAPPSGPSPSTGRTPCASMVGSSAGHALLPQGAEENEPRRGWCSRSLIRTLHWGRGTGLRPLSAALEEEGFDDLGSGRLVESFAATSCRARCLAGTRVRRDREELSRPLAPEAACVATSLKTAISSVRRIVTNASTGDVEPRSAAARAGPALVARPRDRRAAAVRLLRTIRLDPSDTFVFRGAPADPGDMGGVGRLSCSRMPIRMRSRANHARPSRRFLGVASFAGRHGADRERDGRGSPRAGRHAGKAAARAPRRAGLRCSTRGGGRRVAFAACFAIIPATTLIAVRRTFEDGAIREAFRTLQSARHAQAHARVLVPGGRERRRVERRDTSCRAGEGETK